MTWGKQIDVELVFNNKHYFVDLLYPDPSGCSMAAIEMDDNINLMGKPVTAEMMELADSTPLGDADCVFAKRNNEWRLTMLSFCPESNGVSIDG